ncbi:GGDEF domain-containing protein [Sodalis sp. dw_96]|uniref:sensor domain-containing diguanylate cyclase n=1 Tax=Sodalis sp. dw_96 TaxID=2719794 RepID=UPI001BD55F9B|nr:GGDEF domain-containing protein [Sodalis sp. dw_96]
MRKIRPFGSPRQRAREYSVYGRQRFTLMFQLGASATLLILALILLNGLHLWRTYHQALARSEANTANLTQALTQHASDTFVQAEATLEELTEIINQQGLTSEKLPGLHRLFQEKTHGLQQIDAISFYNALGRMVVTAADTLPSVNDFSDRDYFIYHRDHADLTIRIGQVIRSRMTHELILPLSRRLNNPDGSFAGVLLESVMISHFRHFYTKFIISDDSTLMMLLNNGTVLYRHPYNEKVIGTTIADSPLFKDNIRQNQSGTVNSALSNDPQSMVYSYAHLKQFPVIITSGVTMDQALADWRRDAFSHAAMTLIFVLMISLTCLLLMRQVRARMRIELELIHAQQELRKLNTSLEKLARSDGLTGLYNRRHFDLVFKNEFKRAIEYHRPLGLILLDIDFFKQYNDIYGHVAGDECLQLIGNALLELPLRQRDLVARYGGEEFIVLLPETDKNGALAVASRIHDRIGQLEIQHRGSPVGSISASIGIYVGLPIINVDTPSKLVVRVDGALYEAKRRGRNRICEA